MKQKKRLMLLQNLQKTRQDKKIATSVILRKSKWETHFFIGEQNARRKAKV